MGGPSRRPVPVASMKRWPSFSPASMRGENGQGALQQGPHGLLVALGVRRQDAGVAAQARRPGERHALADPGR